MFSLRVVELDYVGILNPRQESKSMNCAYTFSLEMFAALIGNLKSNQSEFHATPARKIIHPVKR